MITGWDIDGMSGVELCRAIRELKRPRYSYLIISSWRADKDDLMAAFSAGADDYLTRPFNSLELRLRLRNGERMLELEDQLWQGAGTDSATGLVSGASFRQFFRVVVAEARRVDTTGALVFVRIHNYREIFDEHGIGPAQTLMVEVSKILNNAIRDSDLVARTDDDEFCMLLQHTYWDKCVRTAEKVTEHVDRLTVHYDGAALRPQVSISALNYPVETLSSDDILALPERISYRA